MKKYSGHPSDLEKHRTSQEMIMTDNLHPTRLLMAAILASLLGACSMIPKNSASGTDAASSAQSANGVTTVDKIIPAHQEITPASSIEKSGLSVSYSLKPIHGNHEQLLRLTLIFKNQTNKGRRIWPHITLVDAQGHAVPSYSLKTLRRITSHKNGSGNTEQASDQWADMYWIKSSYRIPPNGIAIGELVYHSKQLHFPMQLTVRIYKDKYHFTAE
jgi:hypothetical protein